MPYLHNEALMNAVGTSGNQSAPVSTRWGCKGGAEQWAGPGAAPKNILRIGFGVVFFGFSVWFCFPRISETLVMIRALCWALVAAAGRARPPDALRGPAQTPRWRLPCGAPQSGLHYG